MSETKENIHPSRLMTILAFAAVYFIWGSTYLGIKYAIETLPPLLMAGTRFLVAGAILYGWARWRETSNGESANNGETGDDASETKPHLSWSEWRTALIVGALLLLCGNGIVTWAETRIASSLAALLIATEPLWIVILNWLRPGGVRPTLRIWFSLAIGFFGVWLLIGGQGLVSGTSDVDVLGAGAVVAAALAWAGGSLYSLHAPTPRSPALASGMYMLTGGVMMLFVGVITGEWSRFAIEAVSMRSLFALLYLTIFGSLIAFTAYNWLLRAVTPTRAATYAYVNPVIAVLLGWAVAGEQVTARMLIASIVIVASVMLIIPHSQSESTRQRCGR